MRNRFLVTVIFLFVFSVFSYFASAQTVYVTEKGKKYHKKNCSIVSEGKRGMVLSEAKKAGYEPCNVCKPLDKAIIEEKKTTAKPQIK